MSSATLRNSFVVCDPSVLELDRLGLEVRPSNLSESGSTVARCVVLFSVVSSLALREGTLDFAASALQNALCRFQSCEAENAKNRKNEGKRTATYHLLALLRAVRGFEHHRALSRTSK